MVEKKTTKNLTRFTDKELQLVKNTFCEQEDLLMSIRKVFLQLDMSEADDVKLRKVMDKEMMPIIRKFFFPEIDGDAHIFQVGDLMYSLKLDDKTPEEAKPHIEVRKLLIQYLKTQLAVLDPRVDAGEDLISFEKMSNSDDYVDILTRNTIITHVEQQLMQIKALAGRKDETTEETLLRLKQDSAK